MVKVRFFLLLTKFLTKKEKAKQKINKNYQRAKQCVKCGIV